jgi:ABC-type branched-subunit amino acid transport system substrate-binding protein
MWRPSIAQTSPEAVHWRHRMTRIAPWAARPRRPLISAVALASLAALAACGSPPGTPATGNTSSGTSGGTLTVAAFNPFTGVDAAFGPEMMAGCQAAAHAINAAGGVLTKTVGCKAVDTRGDPADAVPAATSLVATTPNLLGVLGPSSDEADATAPLINGAKIPMFADSGEASFDHTKLSYFWRITPADDVKGYAMALWAVQHKQLRGAAVFGNDVGSQSNLPTLQKAFKQLGGKMVITQALAPNQSSYRTEVQALIAAKPQVIFTETSPQEAATYLTELKQLSGSLIPMIGTDGTLQPVWLGAVAGAIGKSALHQYYLGEQPYAPAAGASWSAYNAALLASGAVVPKASQWSTDSYSMTDYDATIAMALAALAAHSTSPAAVNAHVAAVTNPGSGKTIVHSYADGVAALRAGHQIQFVGAAGVIDFNQWHNSTGGFELAGYETSGSVQEVGSVTASQIAPLMNP